MDTEQSTGRGCLTDRLHTFQTLLSNVEVTTGEGRSLPLDRAADRAVKRLQTTASRNDSVYLVGNGGSASIVSHLQNDLAIGLGLRAQVFNEAPLLTALSNDYGYDVAFSKITRAWAEPDDLVLAVSSSGQSQNILNCVRTARQQGCHVLTLSGFSPENSLRKAGELNFYVPASQYGLVEVAHTALSHFLTDLAIQENGGKAVK